MVVIARYTSLAKLLRDRYLEVKDSDQDPYTLHDLAESIGISQAYVSTLHAGTADRAVPKWPGDRVYTFLMAHRFTTQELREIAERFELKQLLAYLEASGRPMGMRVARGALEVRFLGAVSAGRFGAAFADDEGEYVDIPANILRHHDPSDIFALDVVGDSMISEETRGSMPQGSRAFFHHRLRPEPGQIVCARLERDDMSVIKVFKYNGGFVTLESLNRKHRPIVIDTDNPAVVEGVLIGVTTPF